MWDIFFYIEYGGCLDCMARGAVGTYTIMPFKKFLDRHSEKQGMERHGSPSGREDYFNSIIFNTDIVGRRTCSCALQLKMKIKSTSPAQVQEGAQIQSFMTSWGMVLGSFGTRNGTVD